MPCIRNSCGTDRRAWPPGRRPTTAMLQRALAHRLTGPATGPGGAGRRRWPHCLRRAGGHHAVPAACRRPPPRRRGRSRAGPRDFRRRPEPCGRADRSGRSRCAAGSPAGWESRLSVRHLQALGPRLVGGRPRPAMTGSRSDDLRRPVGLSRHLMSIIRPERRRTGGRGGHARRVDRRLLARGRASPMPSSATPPTGASPGRDAARSGPAGGMDLGVVRRAALDSAAPISRDRPFSSPASGLSLLRGLRRKPTQRWLFLAEETAAGGFRPRESGGRRAEPPALRRLPARCELSGNCGQVFCCCTARSPSGPGAASVFNRERDPTPRHARDT